MRHDVIATAGAEQTDQPEIMLTRREVGKVLQLGLTAVTELLGSGELPSVKVGGARRVRMTDLIDYLNGLKPDKTTAPARYRFAYIPGQGIVTVPIEGEADPAPAHELARAA